MITAFAFFGMLIGILGFFTGGVGFVAGPPENRTPKLFVAVIGGCMAAACVAVLWD